MVLWLIGLSGAGKTTVAVEVVARLRATGAPVVYLDGDVLREVWGDAPGHTVAGREVNAGRLSRLCRFLDGQGVHVVAAVLSIFPAWRAWNRAHCRQYREVFLDVPLDVLIERDTKGLYRGALAGEIPDVVGVDIPFPRPTDADLTLDSSGRDGDPAALAARIVEAFPLEPRS